MVGVVVALALGATGVHVAQATPAESKVRDLIDAARRACKLEPPASSGVSEYDSGFGGVREVSATVVRKGVGRPPPTRSRRARWEIRDGKLKPLDPMAGEINRRCGDDPGKPGSPFDWRSLPYFGGYDQAYLYLITSERWDRRRPGDEAPAERDRLAGVGRGRRLHLARRVRPRQGLGQAQADGPSARQAVRRRGHPRRGQHARRGLRPRRTADHRRSTCSLNGETDPQGQEETATPSTSAKSRRGCSATARTRS